MKHLYTVIPDTLCSPIIPPRFQFESNSPSHRDEHWVTLSGESLRVYRSGTAKDQHPLHWANRTLDAIEITHVVIYTLLFLMALIGHWYRYAHQLTLLGYHCSGSCV